MTAPRVLLADRPTPALKKLVRALTQAKIRVDLADDAQSAQARYAQATPNVVIVGQTLLGLCKTLKLHDPAVVSVAIVANQAARKAAFRAGVDEALVRPVAAPVLAASIRALALVRHLRLEKLAQGTPIFEALTGFYAFEHFKQALFVEVKRAKRYKLPISLILASIAAHGEAEDPALREELMGGLALAVRSATRDTDLPVAYGVHNVMILLPHTESEGAESVARRILFRVARSPLRHEGRRLKAKLSLGLASSDGERPFSELVHDGTTRLHEAESRGGNCLVVK